MKYFIDKVIHSINYSLVLSEMESLFPQYVVTDEESNKSIPMLESIQVFNGNASLSLSRTDDKQFYTDMGTMTTLEVLGYYEEVFTDPAKDATYKSVWNYTEDLDDGDGGTYNRSQKFGVYSPEFPMPAIEDVRELAQSSVDAECSSHILAAWSSNAQRNVSLGLYEQDVCELCKSEVSLALAENKGYIDDIEALNTIQEVDDYVALIQREILLGGR